ncbi:NADH-quinone oxidoreductase subunit NuoK [Nitrosomonas aestuarii]|uniref:NADH-quinone oxidoreductase subunit K n=1 Tax=Nitrosomonas aestuarii TaxID=52441 RepID=A0A1I4AJC8_9PROT|nr:NADH-quinone oxidoreductase subunit NuoK [Nitrosomonas aestuarii]PTN13279.1 NADH dehydrogenase subunit K [Nitrosomonas aestuarii]SFK55826.1 NADH dehydrogenase subunit K [Nitrosomonas aestuarii]
MIPLSHSLTIAALLFVLGLAIILLRRELLFILMGLEVMFNGVALTAIAAGQYWNNPDGQVLTIFLMVVTAAELAVALILVWLAFEHLKTTQVDMLTRLKDDTKGGAP